MGGQATGPEQLRAEVRDRVERGANLVKVMASGEVITPGSDPLLCQFQLAELRVVVEEAHAAGLPVTAHAHGLPAVEQAVDAEVDGIEHCTCLTPLGIQMPDRLLQRLASRGTVVCPTLGRAAGCHAAGGARCDHAAHRRDLGGAASPCGPDARGGCAAGLRQ